MAFSASKEPPIATMELVSTQYGDDENSAAQYHGEQEPKKFLGSYN
jgi:hypothetical protein